MFKLKDRMNNIINFSLDFISKRLKLNIRHLITYYLSKFYSNKVNKKLIVFGSNNGKTFAGNSRILFLYLTQNSSYNCIWLTSSKKVIKELKDKNYNVVNSRKLFKTIKILKIAQYIFITHSYSDISMISFSPETTFIFEKSHTT